MALINFDPAGTVAEGVNEPSVTVKVLVAVPDDGSVQVRAVEPLPLTDPPPEETVAFVIWLGDAVVGAFTVDKVNGAVDEPPVVSPAPTLLP